ncbi:hypothetical protein [Streptomyces sp. NBC_00658]|uniref:hypothetical protein n=1 Tax=Streptomyces sp. NBC_00658 TaxID=2975800 RepID=UPI00324FA23B
MADGTALFSLISGIGGALIGGVAGVYGPGRIDSRRRRHELRLDVERRRRDDGHRRGDVAAESLAAQAEASVRVQEWCRLVAWTVQDLEANRAVDAAKFDERADEALQAVVRAVSLVNRDPRLNSSYTYAASRQALRGAGASSASVRMHDVTQELRGHVLTSSSSFDGARFTVRAKDIRDSLLDFLLAERGLITDMRGFMNYNGPITGPGNMVRVDGSPSRDVRAAGDGDDDEQPAPSG